MTIYHLNNEKSTIRWEGKKNGADIGGHVKFDEGHFVYEMGKLLEGSAVIDVRTIEADDAPGSDQQHIAEKLKSEDLLDSGQYPLASYKFDAVQETASGKEIRGMFQLKNKAFHLTIPIELSQSGNSLNASGDFSIGRINPMLFDELTEADTTEQDEIQSINVHMSIVAEEEAEES